MDTITEKVGAGDGQRRELAFILGQFDSIELPKEKKYLFKYFRTPIQAAFLKYVHVFGDYANFVDHTGLSCGTEWLRKLYNRLLHLEAAHKQARADMDMHALAQIETGKYHVGDN